MSVSTFTKTGTKATVSAKLPKEVFELEVTNHELLKSAYVGYLANGRENLAKTKTRGAVSGGGKKPWRQKGTGRARFGSSRVPIWRGGGITHGPTGLENYSHKLTTSSKRLALRQALSLKLAAGNVFVIESFECKEGKVKPTHDLMIKLGATRSTLLVLTEIDDLVTKATGNVPYLKVVRPLALNVYDVMNADKLILSQKSIEEITEWLGGSK